MLISCKGAAHPCKMTTLFVSILTFDQASIGLYQAVGSPLHNYGRPFTMPLFRNGVALQNEYLKERRNAAGRKTESLKTAK